MTLMGGTRDQHPDPPIEAGYALPPVTKWFGDRCGEVWGEVERLSASWCAIRAGQVHLGEVGLNSYLEKFWRTGDRRLLEEGVAVQCRAVASADVDRVERAELLDGLGSLLDALHTATGRVELLEEAVAMERRAVSLLETSGEAGDAVVEVRPLQLACLSRLAGLLTKRFERGGDVEVLLEAGRLQGRVMEMSAAAGMRLRSEHYSSVAVTHRRLSEISDDVEVLEQAVLLQRFAVEDTAADDISRPSRVWYLAELLRQLWDRKGEPGFLDEAWATVENLQPESPFDQIDLALTRARLVRCDRRHHDRFAAVAEELATAVEVVNRLRAAEPNPTWRRDLAHRFDGLLGELVVSVVLDGDLDRAIRLIEAERVWLPAPPEGAVAIASTSPRSIPVAWVITGYWETVVITTVDHRTYTSHVLDRPRPAIHGAVAAHTSTQLLAAATSGKQREQHLIAQHQTVDRLCSLATEIAATFPRVEHLLVVPVGICALLPYGAARRDDGHLTDHTTLTIAPSLAWARAAHRPRPGGPSFGAFHPGTGNDKPLPLSPEREQFQQLVGGTVLDRPSAEEVLARLDGADIAHISCHGSYDLQDPFESKLHLEPALTIRAVLEQPSAPWLVNLSACWTAIHDLGATEQHISLATAFLLPGAAHVLANLWTTTTQSSAMFDQAFYSHLANGSHPAVAHRHAIRELRDNLAAHHGTDAHPIHWAPFTHYGSPW